MVETMFWIGKGTSTNCAFVGEAWLAWMFLLVFVTSSTSRPNGKSIGNLKDSPSFFLSKFESKSLWIFLGSCGRFFFSKTCHYATRLELRLKISH